MGTDLLLVKESLVGTRYRVKIFTSKSVDEKFNCHKVRIEILNHERQKKKTSKMILKSLNIKIFPNLTILTEIANPEVETSPKGTN